MKNTLSQLTLLAALLMLTGCFAPMADSEALIDPTEGTTSLKVTTRAYAKSGTCMLLLLRVMNRRCGS